MTTTRRTFLKTVGLLAAGAAVRTPARAFADPTDDEIARDLFARAARESWTTLPMGTLVTTVGRSFLGTPYAAHTLEVPGEEHLVVNLRGLDCTTFVETCLAFARCVKLGEATVGAFRAQLQLIRYRGGAITGYPSRLHYFADWIHDNAAKRVVRDLTGELGGERLEKRINFMTTHRNSYRQLADDTAFLAVRETEATLSARGMLYVPKERMAAVSGQMREGDVIGITSAIDGLDIAHTGLAVRSGGEIRLLHAPMAGKSVEITRNPLHVYLRGNDKQTGAMVARVLDPAA